MFGDSVSLAQKRQSEPKKEKFAEGLFVVNTNRFTALHDEIIRGTGFQEGKFRVKQFYDEKKPTNKEFADFLKHEYGIGGHSGDGEIYFVDHNSKGMFFTHENGEKFKFTWTEVAEMTASIIEKGEYITQADIDLRIQNVRFEQNEGLIADYYDDTSVQRKEQARKILREYGFFLDNKEVPNPLLDTEPDISIDTIQIGDKFKNMHTGEILEIIALTGALTYINDDCTVTKQSGNFAITQNIPFKKLLDDNIYEYIGRDEIVAENPDKLPKTSEIEKPVVDDLLNALHSNFENIPSEKTLDFFGNNNPISYQKRTDILIHELENSEISVTDAINVMSLIGFQFGDDISYKNPDISAENSDKIVFEMVGGGKLEFKDDKMETLAEIEMSSGKISYFSDDLSAKDKEHIAEKSEQFKPKEKQSEKSENFTITDDTLGNGGAKSKFRANIEAIKTLKTLEKEHRPATDSEKETLSKYVGWGGIPQAFDSENKAWNSEFSELKELLTDKEYSSARASTLDAFFTSPTVIDGIYQALENFGFEGGNVLEPSCGVGNFFGKMPDKMRENSKLYGVEIDSISGRIAQKLYPDADISIQGFEKNNFQNGGFDVAVGNVPFGKLSFKE